VAASARDVTAPAATKATASVTITYTAAPPPTATTRSATGVARTSAKLHGTVNGQGLATTYWFQWGTSKHYSHTTAEHHTGTTAKSVSALLRHLKPNTLYHFRVVARTASGTAHGKDMTFRTKPKPKKKKVKPVFTG
jgi:hypothetical protein